MTSDLEKRFDEAMMDVYRRAKTEASYAATRYFQMLNDHRGVETAKTLLRANGESEGFTALWERGRLDLSVEALIHDHPEYHPLFTPEEREMARQRLLLQPWTLSNISSALSLAAFQTGLLSMINIWGRRRWKRENQFR